MIEEWRRTGDARREGQREVDVEAALPQARPARVPLAHDLVHVERSEARGRPLGDAGIDLGDLRIQGRDSNADVGLTAHAPEGDQSDLDLAQQLQGGRQDGELFPLEELLYPPVRIVGIGDPGNGLARALETLEFPGFAGVVDELLDPGLPALPRRLPLCHGASSRANPRLPPPYSTAWCSWGTTQ